MKKTVKLTESELKGMVTKILNEAINGGWEVDSSEAQEAYNFAVDNLGEETINNAIIKCLSSETLAACLAYVFRMYDFREWDSYKESKNI